MGEREYDPGRNEKENEFSEEQWDVNYTGGGSDILSDLDWGEIENYGADSEVDQFLQNNEDAQGYEDLQAAADVGVLKYLRRSESTGIEMGRKREVRDNLTKK